MFRRSLWQYRAILLAVLLLGCSDGGNQTETKGEFDSVLGIRDGLQTLEFQYKPGYIGTKFVDSGKTSLMNVAGKPAQRLSKLTIDKVEYIQNYILQKNDPSFVLAEGRDLMIRAHAHANISNILAPDMRITITGPGGIKFMERLPATGGLPGLPENSNQSVDYTLTPFTQAYLFKIPAEHIKPGEYKVVLEPLPKPDSGLLADKQEDSFTVTPQSQPLSIRLYEGVIKDKHAQLPSKERIIAVLRKYWPVGELNIEMAPRPLIVQSPLDIKELPTLAAEAAKVDESEYLSSKYVSLLQDTVKQFNLTRTYTQSEDIQILFLPIPPGSAHSMQSIIVSDKEWELQLARQFGHALGIGMSAECVLSAKDKKAVASRPETVAEALKGMVVQDDGEFTVEFMEEYRRERRYWTMEWGDKDRIKLGTPNETDLMSTCKAAHFPHPYYYGKVLKNLLEPTPSQPLVNHPSQTIKDYYRTNGLALGPVIRVQIDFESLRRALIRHQYDTVPQPVWANEGELKRLTNTKVKSPHAIVIEGGDGALMMTRIIELFMSSDKKTLVGVTSLFDLPKPIKGYGLYINKVRISSGPVTPVINALHGEPSAKSSKKSGFLQFVWDAREFYSATSAVLLFLPYGQKAELVGIGLKEGGINVEAKTFDPKGNFYLMLPYRYSTGAGGFERGLDIFAAKFD